MSGALAAVVALGSSCSRQTITVLLHPFQASGDVTYACRTPQGEPRPVADCNPAAIDRGELDLFALMTQTATGEVAVINVPNNPASLHSGEGIVDVDPSVPGYGFLHVGGLPSKIVTTPGGSLSVVAVTEPGKPGLFGLPTRCVGAPIPGASGAAGTDRDLISWPACSLLVPSSALAGSGPPELPVAPGSIAIVNAPESDTLCDGRPSPRAAMVEQNADNSVDLSCVAEVALPTGERGPKGRRKIVVTLPDRGSIAIIDAAWLAQGTTPGDFSPCLIEKELPLSPTFTPMSQVLPSDLQVNEMSSASQAPQSGAFKARPSGIALDGTTLYVADNETPVIHVVDLSNPCNPVEQAPLLTRSLDRPDRVVTTSKVAVSPLTPSGRKFVYAIDQDDSPTASIMAFDVSPGATDRTPIVRPRSPLIPGEPPDRILFPGAPRDIKFFERDRPIVDPATGNVVEGLACDPTPGNTGIGTRYRSAADYASGARAVELRGVFGAALLTSGQVAVIDVEDFDAPCRRPVTTNSAATEDFRGCQGDPKLEKTSSLFIEANGTRTVTDEVSCRMVEPHRARAGSLGLTDATRGIHAPTLRGFPQLRIPDQAVQSGPEDRPKLLAVDFALRTKDEPSAAPAQVFVGTGLYSSASRENPLDVAPNSAQRNSIALPFNEPRAYNPNESLSLVYEGFVTDALPAGFVRVDDPSMPFTGSAFTLHDPSVAFCDRGVHDEELMSRIGERLGVTGDAALQSFAQSHSDSVVLVGEFPPADDPSWINSQCGRDACIKEFGDFDPTIPSATPSIEREFRIVDALQQWLKLEPKPNPSLSEKGQEAELAVRNGMAQCCFPSGTPYVVRASNHWVLRSDAYGTRHKVIAARQM
ncbi:MAG TPA: hypothetical protein VFQ35_11975, partial [Polyangiaceae bacterium]|nr:hypothetical protein [Polyangiaceae bacterium]